MTYPIDPDNGLLISWEQPVLSPEQKMGSFDFTGIQKKRYDAMAIKNYTGIFILLNTFNTGDIMTAPWGGGTSANPVLVGTDGTVKQTNIAGYIAGVQGGYYIKDEKNILLANIDYFFDYYDLISGTKKTNLNFQVPSTSLGFNSNGFPFFEQNGLIYSFTVDGSAPGLKGFTFYGGTIPVLTINPFLSSPYNFTVNSRFFSTTGDLYILLNIANVSSHSVTTYIFKYNIYSNIFSTYFSSTISSADNWIVSNYFIQDIAIDYAGNVYGAMSMSTGNPNITMQLIKITGPSSYSVLSILDTVNDAGNSLPVMSIATLYNNTVELYKYANVPKTPYPSMIEPYKVIPPNIPIAPIINT